MDTQYISFPPPYEDKKWTIGSAKTCMEDVEIYAAFHFPPVAVKGTQDQTSSYAQGVEGLRKVHEVLSFGVWR